MSRKRSSRALESQDYSTSARLDRLIGDARLKVGFIIPAEAEDALKANPPSDPEALTDALLVAAGNDPLYIDESVRRSVRELVDARMG
jgi:hypothetical protein